MINLDNIFEETINKKLSNPNITTKEIQELATAYSELKKNDWMKEMFNKTSGYGFGFGGYQPPDTSKGPNDIPLGLVETRTPAGADRFVYQTTSMEDT